MTILLVMQLMLLAVLQFLDGWSTAVVLTHNIGVEANPLAAFIITSVGVYPALVAVKSVILAAIIMATIEAFKIKSEKKLTRYFYLTFGINMIYVAVIINNISILVKAGA